MSILTQTAAQKTEFLAAGEASGLATAVALATERARIDAWTGSMKIGLFTAAPTRNIPVGTDLIQTSGHHIVGVGPALYAAVATDPGLQGAGQFQSANGRWFRIVIVNGVVPIEQAGGVGDSTWNGATVTPGTDNLGPYYDARTWVVPGTNDPRFVWQGTVWFGGSIRGNDYYFSDTINQHGLGGIAGPGSGADNFNNEIRLHWTGNRDSIVLNRHNTDGRLFVPAANLKWAVGFTIEGLSIFNQTVTARDCHGIRARCRWNGRNLFINHISYGALTLKGGNAIHMEAVGGGGASVASDGTTREGNCNYSHLQNITIYAGGYGIWVMGADSNASTFIDIKVRSCGLGGWVDNITLGNTWIGGGVDECGTSTDSGYVTWKGLKWMLVNFTPGIGGATEPGTNVAVWYELTGYRGYPLTPTWVSGGSYMPSAAISFKGAVNQGTWRSPYVEGYMCDASGSRCSGEGGAIDWTRGSAASVGNNGNSIANNGWGVKYTLPSSSRYWSGDPNSSNFDAILGGDSENGTLLQWNFTSNAYNDYRKRFRDVDDDLIMDYGTGNGSTGLWGRFTGSYTLQKFGGIVGVPFATKFNTLLIAAYNDPTPGTLLTTALAAPTTGVFKRGDYVQNRNIASGQPKGWGCSVSGAKGSIAWTANGQFYSFGQVRTNGGNAYVNVLPPARAANTAYAVGDMFSNMGKPYIVTTAGTTSTSANGANGFAAAITDGTCVVAFVNASITATSGGPTGTNAATPVRDGTVWWIYQPAFVFIDDVNWP